MALSVDLNKSILMYRAVLSLMVEQLFLEMPQDCLRFVIVVFPDHTHLTIFEEVLLLLGKVSMLQVYHYEKSGTDKGYSVECIMQQLISK